MPTPYTLADYITDLRRIRSTGSATAETSYYPPIDRLFNASGQTLDPPVLFSTQLRNSGAGMPDGGFFPQPKRQRRTAEPQPLTNPERGVVEIKPADYSLDSLTNQPQTLGYLNRYGLVLITNLRQFRLLKLVSGHPQIAEQYTLADTPADLWSAPLAQFAKHKQLLPDFLARVMLYRAPLAQPKDVAWLLASYAREARARAEDHPLASFDAVKKALQESLGIRFEGDKGEHFFRSTLVQTLFYGIFSAWVLWHRSPAGRLPGALFDWRLSAYYLRVPVLRKLFGEMADPGALNSIQLQSVLDLAGDALNRVQPAFFETFREDDAVAYFYEPFLEAFDPQLRKDLGVWYTPREIVEYMVARVDHLLRTQLNQPLGLASPAVRILDPCCGTGAYLTAVLHRIHQTLLENAGDDTALVPSALRTAALTRVYGFEIMPAPFVIAHLQIASLLETAHAPLTDEHRAGVYLTNALTGWVPERHPQSAIFREFEKEREDSEHIKQQGTILVILGNPPYNGYAGIAKIDEERDLTTAYREPIPGLPAPQGQGLNDLYVRFFRIAERRIVGDANVHGNQGGCGIVSFISNNAWLDGLSHVSMRKRYIDAFQNIYIDNLNGDKYRTGKVTPEGLPDPSAFSTPQNREGIQVGTAIATLVRTGTAGTGTTGMVGQGFSPGNQGTKTAGALAPEEHPASEGAGGFNPRKNRVKSEPALAADGRSSSPAEADVTNQIHLRDLWGATKLAQLQRESRHESDPTYTALTPAPSLGNPLAHRTQTAAYTKWPRLPELFPTSFPGIKTSRDALLIDIDREQLVARMHRYFDPNVSDAEIVRQALGAMVATARFNPHATRNTLLERGFREWQILRYCYRPFDLRWLYWEPTTKLLDEKREGYAAQMIGATIWVEARQRESGDSFSRGAVTRSIADNSGNGLSSYFPLVVIDERARIAGLLPTDLNLSNLAEAYISQINRAKQTSTVAGQAKLAQEPPTIEFAIIGHQVFYHALAIMHTPAYRTENAGALLGDWPRIPLPATAYLLSHSASLGRRLAELLDAESSINLSAEWSFLAALKLPLHPNLDGALKLTAGWGHKGQGSTVMPGRGLAPERPWTETERQKLAALATTNPGAPEPALSLSKGPSHLGTGDISAPHHAPIENGGAPGLSHLETGDGQLQSIRTLLGETCVDVYLNGDAHWSAVPINVWNYTLGGYQVLKKWLSYREFTTEPTSPLLHRPLNPEEAAYFAQVVRRIAAILLLGPALDENYRAILPTATGLPTF